MRYDNQTFTGVDIELDGNIFIRCTFSNCNLTYRGGTLPELNNCTLDNANFLFKDAAGLTTLFLAQMYQSGRDAQVKALLTTLKPQSANDTVITVDSDISN